MEGFGGYTADVSAIPSGSVLIQNADTLYIYNAKQEQLLRSISFQQTGSRANGFARAAKTHQEWPKPVHLFRSAALSPDGTTLAVGLGESGVSVFPVDSVKKSQHLKTIGPYVGFVCFAPDGKTLAVSSSDTPKIGVETKGQVELFDLTSGKKKVVPTGDSRNAGQMRFDTDGKRLVIYEGGAVQTWDVARSREINRLKFKLTDIRAVASSHDGKLFAIANTFGYEVWNLEDGKRILSSRPRD
jgi:WD40 repeat protein